MLEKTRKNKRGNDTKIFAIRLTMEEAAKLIAKSRKYTKKNYSEFIRHAIVNWEPKK